MIIGRRLCRYGMTYYLGYDIVLGAAVEAYGEWFEAEVDVFRLYCGPDDTVVDVGSNIGTHSMALASVVGPRGRVVAIEPQRPLFMLLCTNAVLNNYLQIEPYRAVAGPHCTTAPFARTDYSQPGSFGGYNAALMASLSVMNTASNAREVLPVVTLDSLGCHDAKFIKIDVEGMEAEVIEGAKDTIARSQPVLYVENDRVAKSPALIRTLRHLGYKPYWHVAPFFNENNFAENNEQLDIHSLGIHRNDGQFWVNGASINMLCLPKAKQLPLPPDVVEVGSEDEHPCQPQHWGRLLGHLKIPGLSNVNAA